MARVNNLNTDGAGQQAAARVIADWQEIRVKDALGQEFRSTSSRVVVRRPRWMPARLFRHLMRSIVIEERQAQRPPRRLRRSVRAR